MRAKKSLGQHFLKSKQVVKTIVDAADISHTDTVLEIGPGKGVLTRELLTRAQKVIAIEKDGDLIPLLEETFADDIQSGGLQIIHDDVRSITIESLINSPYKVVANIPYYITGELIEHFLTNKRQPETLVFLVQKEVANRIARERKESILSISVKVYGKPRYIQTVKAKMFSPPPEVDSAILKISDISRDFFQNIDEKTFFSLVKQGFSQKRKLLVNNLQKEGLSKEEIEKSLTNCNISTKARAETLLKEDWRCLFRLIA